tara:strand:- start:113 stop:670 length:558 start_codon:yes stop_codon:yes gene_type:complete
MTIISEKFLQNLKKNLLDHHKVYKKIRCKGEYLEEVLTSSFELSGFNVSWKPGSHDKKKDLIVRNNSLSVKSGVLMPKKKMLEISGHRLTRFDRNLNKISKYLNNSTDTLSVYNPKRKSLDQKYSLAFIKKEKFSGIVESKWKDLGKSYIQSNDYGVQFKIQKDMSDQIWWQIPIKNLDIDEIII